MAGAKEGRRVFACHSEWQFIMISIKLYSYFSFVLTVSCDKVSYKLRQFGQTFHMCIYDIVVLVDIHHNLQFVT